MSRTKRNIKHWSFKSHSRADFAARAEALVETDYRPRNRHRSRARLVSAWDDRYPSALADKWQEHELPANTRARYFDTILISK